VQLLALLLVALQGVLLAWLLAGALLLMARVQSWAMWLGQWPH
jgi:hypothetical protein